MVTSQVKKQPGNPANLISGTLAVALMLAATKWGSYLGANPIFVTDMLIALAVLSRLVAFARSGSRDLSGWARLASPSPLLVMFMAFVAIRFTTSLGYFESIVVLRDAVPYLYGILAFLSASSVARASECERALTVKVLWAALLFHLFWTSVIVLTGFDTLSLPTMTNSDVHFLTIRPDIDAAVLGVTAGALLRQALFGRRTWVALLGAALATVTVLQLETRAGLVSLTLSLAVAVITSMGSLPHRSMRRASIALLIALALPGVLAFIPSTPLGQRIMATVNSAQTTSTARAEAQGTQTARQLAWVRVANWTGDTPSRQVFGTGFGTDFLAQSGAQVFLEGTTYENVRSPHNWLIATYARLGLIGLGLAGLLLLQITRLMWANRARIGEDDLLSMATLIVLAILPVALLGVVLEAPFGAVPFFWAAGILLTMRRPQLTNQQPHTNASPHKNSQAFNATAS